MLLENLGGIFLASIRQMGFLWKILGFSFAGLIAAEIIFKGFPGLAKIAGKPLRPLTRLCGLPEEVGSLLLSSLFTSTMATNSALAALRESGSINERQIVVAAILNSIPAYIRRIMVFLLPVFVPLFGWMFFLGVVFCHIFVIMAKISFCVFYGRIISGGMESETKEKKKKPIAKIGIRPPQKYSLKKPLKMFFRMAITLLIVTFLVFFLVNAGILNQAAAFLLTPLIKLFGLPESFSAPLMVFSTGSIVAGGGVLKNLILEGVINRREAFIGILLGILVSQPAVVARHVLPSYMGVFGRKTAFKIIGISLTVIIVVRTITFLVFKSALL